MTGDVPQPGETPIDQGSPWALPDAGGTWWHREPRPETPGTGPAVTAAPSAVARDLTRHRAEPPAVEHPATGHPGGSRLATEGELMIIEPTRTARPGVTPLPEVLGQPAVEARLEKMENSSFWLSEEERAAEPAGGDRPPGSRRRAPAHNPLTALLCLVVLSLLAAFFGWVSAEPFWLATGHGSRGYATTTHCHGDGLTQRCTGRFTSADGGFAVSSVTLLGIAGEQRHPGAVSPARMVSRDSDQAYTAPAGPLMHLRWGVGFLLVLICGQAIAALTGARRLPTRPTRRSATIASFLGPLLLLGGFLASAY